MNAEWMQKNAPGLWAFDQETRRRDEERRKIVEQTERQIQEQRRRQRDPQAREAFDQVLRLMAGPSNNADTAVELTKRDIADCGNDRERNELQARLRWRELVARGWSVAAAAVRQLQSETCDPIEETQLQEVL